MIVRTLGTSPQKRATRVATLLAAVLSVAFPSWGAASSRIARILVAQADATPVAGAHVAAFAWETPAQRRGRLFSANPVPKPLAAGLTGSDGSVTLRVPDLPVLAFDVVAEGFMPRRLSVPRGDDRPVIVVSHAVPTCGHAVWNGVGQEGVTIVWLSEDGTEILRRSGPGGELQVPFVPTGHGRIAAQVLDPRFSSHAKSSVASDGAFVVGLSRGQDFDGRVTEPDGIAPAGSATITMGEGRTTRSDEQGRFTIRHYVPGSGEVVVRKGSLVGTLSRQSPAEQVTLTPGVFLRGRVRDLLSGRPIAGGLVSADRGGFEAVLTGEDGTFELGPGVPIGREETRISVQHPGFEPLQTSVRLDSASPIELDLASSPVEGVVVDPDGHPVGGALVQCLERRGVATVMTADCGESLTDGNGRFRLLARPFGRVIGQVRNAADDSPVRRFSIPSANRLSGQDREFVDRDGRFVLDDVGPGAITMEVEADGYLPAVADVLVPEEGEVEADFRLDRGCWLEATTFGPDGQPAETAEVRITAVDQPAAIPQLDTLSHFSQGVFGRWTWCGPVRMEVSSREYRSALVEVDTTVVGRVEVRLGTPQTLRGAIVDEVGEPVPGAEVCAGRPATHAFYPCVVSEDDGSFVLAKLRDDRVSIEVRARGFDTLSLPDVPVSEAAALRLVLRRPPEAPAVVSGRLLGLPEDFHFCEVGAYRGDEKVAEDVVVRSEHYRVEFPGGGRITMRSTVCGVRLGVRLAGESFGCLHFEPVEVDARAGQETEADLRVGSLVLSLRVSVNETPLSWAVVWAKPVWGSKGTGMVVRCDHEGLATGLEPFPAGLFEFEVNSPVLAAPYRFVREIRQSGVVHLDLRPALLQGAVTGPDGLPVAGAVVDLATPAAGHPRRVVTGGTGTFRFFDVAPGPVRLTVSASGFETRSDDIHVPSTSLADARINLSRR